MHLETVRGRTRAYLSAESEHPDVTTRAYDRSAVMLARDHLSLRELAEATQLTVDELVAITSPWGRLDMSSDRLHRAALQATAAVERQENSWAHLGA